MRTYSQEEKHELLKALSIQSACNLTAVLHSWAQASSVVREAIRTNHGDTFNKHPINILYMSKVASMLAVNSDSIGGVNGTKPGEQSDSDLAYWAFGEAMRLQEEADASL